MQRKSNIELLRIVAMLLVVWVHTNYFSLGDVEWGDVVASPFNSFLKVFAEQLCIICVDVFVLISGWFGIRPSVKGAMSLLFQVFFFHILVVACLSIAGEPASSREISRGFNIGYSYWFIVSYLILYALAPVLNVFIKNATPRLFLSVLIAFFVLEFTFGWIGPRIYYRQGYSTISFIGLYLLAQYIRNYSTKLLSFSVGKNFLLYLLFTLLPVSIYFIVGKDWNMLAYSSPFVISASVFFFLAFNKMNISSKVINYLACSALSIYLVHQNPLLIKPFISLMKHAYMSLGGYLYVLFVIIFAICFGLLCIMVDKVRIYVWNIICRLFLDKLTSRFEKLMEKL